MTAEEQMDVLRQDMDARQFERTRNSDRALTMEQALRFALGENTGYAITGRTFLSPLTWKTPRQPILCGGSPISLCGSHSKKRVAEEANYPAPRRGAVSVSHTCHERTLALEQCKGLLWKTHAEQRDEPACITTLISNYPFG